jgi:hypothetical protein
MLLALPASIQRWSVHEIRAIAKNEALAFLHLVQSGQITVDEALEDLGLEPEQREFLTEYATAVGGAVARDIANVIEVRDLAVEEFQRLIAIQPGSKAA